MKTISVTRQNNKKENETLQVPCIKYSEKCNIGIAEIIRYDLVKTVLGRTGKEKQVPWFTGISIPEGLRVYKHSGVSTVEELERIKAELNHPEWIIKPEKIYTLTHPETGLNIGARGSKAACIRVLNALENTSFTLIKDTDPAKVVNAIGEKALSELRNIQHLEDSGQLSKKQ